MHALLGRWYPDAFPCWQGVCRLLDTNSETLADHVRSDGNIRYYEYENDKFEYLSEYKSADPQRGVAFVPKRGVNTHENEVMRCYKTVGDAYIEPISFVVPRRAEVFQNDIYPPAPGATPFMSSGEYYSGKEAGVAPKITMESLYEGETPVEIPADQVPKPAQVKSTPAPTQAKAPEPAPAAKSQPAPEPAVTRAPTSSSIKENQQSMSAAAAKFADKEEESSEDDAKSFEEIPKPVERPRVVVSEKQEEKIGVKPSPAAEALKSPEPTKTSSAPAPEPAAEPTAGTSSAAKGAAEGIKGVLQEIKTMLAQQSGQIESLTQEVASLKARLDAA